MSHALLSASGSKRWLSCPPSARLEEQFPDSKSEYAAEGTLAHDLAEQKLKCYINPVSKSEKEYVRIQKSKYFSSELEVYVDEYTDFVKERINAAYAQTKDAVVMLEQRLDFSQWVPDGFGTGDVVIVADGYVEIIDLKYGKGVSVSAEDNTQMRLYALGAYNELSFLYDIQTVKMTICQPRLDNISTEEITVTELLKWADEVVKPIAKLAIAGEGEFKSGDHCRFCRAKATCRTRAEANLEMAKYDFIEPPLLTDEDIGEILKAAENLQAWGKDIKDYALTQAEKHGKKYPGWKLVEGRSNRVYANEGDIAIALSDAGYAEHDIYKPREVRGITDMEKTITKAMFSALLGDLIIKPPGKPTLVPESDKRPEISSITAAQKDFEEEFINE